MISTYSATEQILEHLAAKVQAHWPVMIASAGSGLVAQLLEKVGAATAFATNESMKLD